MFELCASILAADFANLERDMRAANAAGVDAFHIDVMDGHFVPAISFGTGMVRTMERLTTKPLDVHLMVEKPLDFLPELEELGVKRVSVHYEIPGGPEAALRAICAAGMQAGLVLNPETPVESALPYLAQISQLLLMTVHPGCGGQVYLPGSNEKIAAAKSLLQGQGSNIVIQVDGGITPGTLPGAYAAGARSIVAGSAVFYGNIYQNVCALRSEKAKPQMFVVKGGTKKKQTVWQMNVPQNLYGLIARFATIRRKQRFIKIHWRFVSRCIARNAKRKCG